MSNIAILTSGGLDSSILTVDLGRSGHRVFPLYIEHGLHWEPVELACLKNFLSAVKSENIEPLEVLKLPITETYGSHWSVLGENVPDETTEDEAVYLPGRNLLLLAKTSVWCALNGIDTIALAPLKGNPFSDNTDAFYQSMEQTLRISYGKTISIIRPYAEKSKNEVLEIGRDMPLELTFSCIRPENDIHCGHCNKCAERQSAYRHLGVVDPTAYHR